MICKKRLRMFTEQHKMPINSIGWESSYVVSNTYRTHAKCIQKFILAFERKIFLISHGIKCYAGSYR
jgi:hypothetical protein